LQIVQVEDAVAIPVDHLALEASGQKCVGDWADFGVVQRGENGVAGEQELAALALDALEIDVCPTLEEAADILDGIAVLEADILVEEPLSLPGKRYVDVLDDSLGEIVGLAGTVERPVGMGLEVEIARIARGPFGEAAEQKCLVMIASVFV
jgi:hypothetical protein